MPDRTTEALHAFVIDIASKNHAALAWASVDAGRVRCAFAVMGMRQRCQLPNRKFLLALSSNESSVPFSAARSGAPRCRTPRLSLAASLRICSQQIRNVALPVAMAALAWRRAPVLGGGNLRQVSQRAPY